MSRFMRNTSNDSSRIQDDIDKAYTLLYYAHNALLTTCDYAAASKVDEVLLDYRLKGAKLRYEYAPR